MGVVPVTEENKTRSYYKYYEMGAEDPTQIQISRILKSKGKMGEGLPISERAKVQDGTYPEKTGFYPLEEGGVMVASYLDAPNVTGDMMYWWFAWHCLDNFRYTIWDPDDHYAISVDEAGLALEKDESIPICQKTWGATHTALETLNPEQEEGHFRLMFKNPADLGYDLSKIGTDECQFLIVGNVVFEEMNVPIHVSLMLKKVDGANQIQERFWIGYHIIDGEGKCLLPPDIEIPDDLCYGLLLHNIKEYGNLAKILPTLYAEEGEKDLFYDLG